MVNVTGTVYHKTTGQKYAEGIVLGQSQLGTFQKIYFKVTAIKGKGFTEEQFNRLKLVQWKLTNITKSVTVNMNPYPVYNEVYVDFNWIGDLIRAEPKLGCTELEVVEFYINTYYT